MRLHAFPVCTPAFSHSPKIRCNCDSKLAAGLTVKVNGCLCLCVACVIDWSHVQGDPCMCIVQPGIGYSPPCSPELSSWENGWFAL